MFTHLWQSRGRVLTANVGWTDLTCNKLPCACSPRGQSEVKLDNAIKMKPTSHTKRSVCTTNTTR